jgi:cobalamin synthase
MDSRKKILKDTAVIALGEVLCSAVMVGIFAALGYFSITVLVSALAGCFVITLNYLFMAITVSLAADRAAQGDVEQGKKMISLSSTVRLVCMGIVLLVALKLGANAIALLLPLVFLRPILMLVEFFGKKVD